MPAPRTSGVFGPREPRRAALGRSVPGRSVPGRSVLGRSVPGLGPPPDAATEAVETTMYRALAVLRVVVLVNTVGTSIYYREAFARPVLAAVVLLGLGAWTAVAVWAYDKPSRRRPPLLVADLMITFAAVLVTPLVKDGTTTLPGFWAMGAVLAWGIHGHWLGGLTASLAVSLADVAIRTDLDQGNYGNIFLLMIGGPVLGYTSGLLKEMAAARDRAEREAAAAAERARLARAVHDGVLQVLALVQRRGLEMGGDAAELGRLAGEQEVALRALVQGASASASASASAGAAGAVRDDVGVTADLTEAVRSLGSGRVTVSVPAIPVQLPTARVAEVVAAVRACLDNATRHAGDHARAWVLLEDLGATVVVTVRDDGAGIPPGRLDEAAEEGRLGIAQSIRGRVQDLGGTARLVTAPGQGTEWELTFPRRGPA
jgi:signal transduction histidine kinase